MSEYRTTIISVMRSIEDSYPFPLCQYYAYLDMIYNKIIDTKYMKLVED